MIRRIASHLRRDIGATTAIEFAVTASALLLFVIGILQGGVMYWTWQALQGAAIEAARCAAINAQSCTTAAATQTFAVNSASLRGIAVTTSQINVNEVTATTGGSIAGCGNVPSGTGYVSVTYTYPVTTIPLFNISPTITAGSCFPLAN
jgi:Flp pilus assembly protein TadG